MVLEIYTPEQKYFEGQVESVIFPGSGGSFQVLNNHAALISTLDRGKVKYKDKKEEWEVIIDGGVVEVLNNRVVLLADGITEVEEGAV
ncbi:MAG TPA: ATP synthase F1 subunit epsilon [Cyclobacteriaceae bacterium]|nr:ATP synthase F1 subunit epsilon [Cyclobacteriaceae bacterium]